MLFGLRLSVLRVVLLLMLGAYASPSYATDETIDTQAKGLAHYLMALCFDQDGQGAQAISELKQSVKFNGLESAPRLKLGAYYLREDKISLAKEQLETVAHLSPADPQAHYLLALLYSAEHQYDLAASEYETILKLASAGDPANTDVYMYLGQLYYAEGRYDQAVRQFQKIIRLDADNTAAIFLLGSVYADTHERAKAIEAFRKVLQIDPDHSEALNALGYLYAEDGVHLDQAIAMIRKAISIDGTNGAYEDSLGWALYKKKMYNDALIVLQKAQSLIEDGILYDHLGDVYKALNQYTFACKFWQKSLDKDSHQILVQRKIKELEKCIASRSTHRLN